MIFDNGAALGKFKQSKLKAYLLIEVGFIFVSILNRQSYRLVGFLSYLKLLQRAHLYLDPHHNND